MESRVSTVVNVAIGMFGLRGGGIANAFELDRNGPQPGGCRGDGGLGLGGRLGDDGPPNQARKKPALAKLLRVLPRVISQLGLG